MKIICSLIIVGMFQFPVHAQDKDAVAKVHYTNAEEFFNKGSLGGYDSCVIELEQAEKALGTTNSKILYLKIKAMSQFTIPYHDWFYVYDLDSSIKSFFKIVDEKNYPTDKYLEVVNINDKFKRGNISKMQTYRYSDSAFLERGDYFKLEKQIQFARICYLNAADKGNVDAMRKLGDLFERDVRDMAYAPKNSWDEVPYGDAEYWYDKAGKGGSSSSWKKLGSMYKFIARAALPYNINFDYKALKYLTAAYENDDEDASYELGEMYERGWGTKQDYKKALEYYIKATACSKCYHARHAMNSISKFYLIGLGVKKDKELAKEWAQKAKHAEEAWEK